jgi:3-hydroxy-9,10-secoandrosta-1,3,5(10)-triene-9,17-dione monooxygenase
MDTTKPTQAAGVIYARADVVKAAAALVPTLRSRAAETDTLSKLPDTTLADFEQAQLFEMAVPQLYGGLQSSLETSLDVLIEIGRGDGAAAWTLGMMSTATWMAAALYPKHVTDQVFAKGGDFRTASSLALRTAHTKRSAGGYVIEDGLWMYGTGVYHSYWMHLAIPVVDDAGRPAGLGLALVPTSDVITLDDWDAIGLRGSGSTSVAVKDLFVPDERVSLMSRNLRDDYTSTHLRNERIYTMPLIPLLATRLVCPMLGMARAALELFMAGIDTRGIAYLTYQKQSDASVTHLRIGEASAKLDAAESIIRHSIWSLEASACDHERMALEQRARIWRDAGFASRLIWEAVDRLAGASGTAFINRHAPMSRVWHDVRVANMHGGIHIDTCLELYGRVAAGKAPNTLLLPDLPN